MVICKSASKNALPSKSFFFSSRRRHTMSKRDWSSDVCSSDLSDKPNMPLLPPILQKTGRDISHIFFCAGHLQNLLWGEMLADIGVMLFDVLECCHCVAEII